MNDDPTAQCIATGLRTAAELLNPTMDAWS